MFSVRTGQLAGYGAGYFLLKTSWASAQRGIRHLNQAVFGTFPKEGEVDETAQGRSLQGSFFTQILFGKDTLRERAVHSLKGIFHIVASSVSALAGYFFLVEYPRTYRIDPEVIRREEALSNQEISLLSENLRELEEEFDRWSGNFCIFDQLLASLTEKPQVRSCFEPGEKDLSFCARLMDLTSLAYFRYDYLFERKVMEVFEKTAESKKRAEEAAKTYFLHKEENLKRSLILLYWPFNEDIFGICHPGWKRLKEVLGKIPFMADLFLLLSRDIPFFNQEIVEECAIYRKSKEETEEMLDIADASLKAYAPSPLHFNCSLPSLYEEEPKGVLASVRSFLSRNAIIASSPKERRRELPDRSFDSFSLKPENVWDTEELFEKLLPGVKIDFFDSRRSDANLRGDMWVSVLDRIRESMKFSLEARHFEKSFFHLFPKEKEDFFANKAVKP